MNLLMFATPISFTRYQFILSPPITLVLRHVTESHEWNRLCDRNHETNLSTDLSLMILDNLESTCCSVVQNDTTPWNFCNYWEIPMIMGIVASHLGRGCQSELYHESDLQYSSIISLDSAQ